MSGDAASAAASRPFGMDMAWIPAHWTAVPSAPRADAAAVERHLRAQRPVLLTGGSLVPTSHWEDIGALVGRLGGTQVLVKRSGRERVAYFREDRNTGRHSFDGESFVAEARVAFPEFVRMAHEAQTTPARGAAPARGEGCPAQADSRPEGVLYCQESFTGHPELSEEFRSWDWQWIMEQTGRHGWGDPETSVLFMGSEGATTPAHFDEQHNFLNQVRGEKLVVLFPPDDYTRLYPFPVTHPCDRCSMVDVRSPDLRSFPRFAEARGQVATLRPGDLLYIPHGWWHYCRTLTHLAASVAFWAQDAPADPLAGSGGAPRPLGAAALARARRNLEKLLAEDVGAPELDGEVQRLLELMQPTAAPLAEGDPRGGRLRALRGLLGALEVPEEQQVEFLVETFGGRFGVDLNAHV